MLALKKDLPRPIAPPPNGSALKAVENFDVTCGTLWRIPR